MAEQEHNDDKHVEVRVVTTSGSYPATGTERVAANQPIKNTLKTAAKELKIVNRANASARRAFGGVVEHRSITLRHSVAYRSSGAELVGSVSFSVEQVRRLVRSTRSSVCWSASSGQ